MRRVWTGLAVASAAVGMVMTGGGVASASESHGHAVQVVRVTGSAQGLQFSTTRVHEGLVRFEISTVNPNGTGVTLFTPHRGVTLATLETDLTQEFSSTPATAAQGTRNLEHDVTIYGLADVNPGTPASVTVALPEGTYYSFDSNSGVLPTAATVTRIVVGEGRDGDESQTLTGRDHHLASVSLTSTDRFLVRGHLPAHGSVLVRNVSDTIHFMVLQPVQAGTTDAQVQAYFDSGSQAAPPFALNGPSLSTDVLSAGRSLVLGYSLPKGTYVLLCFVADDQTGMPHALMGMHKVVTLG